MNKLLNFALAFTFLLIAGCAKNEKPDTLIEQEKVRQVFSDFIKTLEAGDVDGYFSYITDDFIGYDAGREPITDIAAFRSELGGFLANNTFELSNYKSQEVIVRNDIAIHRHRGTVTISPKGDTTQMQLDLKYLDILRKNEDGDWKIYMHTASPNN